MTHPRSPQAARDGLTPREASFERALLVKLLHDRHHDQDCERTADAILTRGFRFMGKGAALAAATPEPPDLRDAALKSVLRRMLDGGSYYPSGLATFRHFRTEAGVASFPMTEAEFKALHAVIAGDR